MMLAEKYTVLFDIKYILKASTDVLYVSFNEFEIHTTRWLLWHSDFTKFNFAPPRTPLGSLRCFPRTPSRRFSMNFLVVWGGGYPIIIPYPFDAFGVSLSTPSAFHTRASVSSDSMALYKCCYYYDYDYDYYYYYYYLKILCPTV